MNAKLQTSTLINYVKTIQTNFKGVMDGFPQLYLASEALNDLFDQLFTQRVVPNEDELWQTESLRLLFGTFSSWSHSLIMTAAGFGEHGLSAMRRSIEFTCYISKVKDSNDRARLWVERRDSLANKRQFAREFGVPRAYFSEDYSHLKSLLVWHDHASDYGAHGNFASLATKWRDVDNTFTMSLHDDPKSVPLSTGVAIQLGSSILESLMVDLSSLIKGPDQFRASVSTFKDMLTKTKLELARYELPNGMTPDILKTIESPDEKVLDEEFEELKKSYSK